MKTEIRIIAEMTDEQCEVLLSELINTSEIIGIKLEVESSKLSQHDVSKRTSLESKNNIILDINQWTQILLANRKTIRERPLWAMIADINNRTTD